MVIKGNPSYSNKTALSFGRPALRKTPHPGEAGPRFAAGDANYLVIVPLFLILTVLALLTE